MEISQSHCTNILGLLSKLNIKIEQKDDLSVFEHGMVVGVSVSEAGIFLHSHLWGLQKVV